MPDLAPAPAGRFRLMRFFTLTTLAVFAAAGVTLVLLQREEEAFFAKVQQQQREFFAKAQAELARQNENAARRSLLAVHEASHVNLTQLVANTMWDSDFAPLVAAAQRLPIEPCRGLGMATGDGLALAAARHGCFAEIGRRIVAQPGFAALDRKAYAAMRGTSVFKIKVFDLRGVTVYSSEHTQIGEDGGGNLGWQTAVRGRPASELTHRERFSAFERVVEDRDLISSYVPVHAGPAGAVVGVVELYSDVTPFLAQIEAARKAFAGNIAANEASVASTAEANEREVKGNSNEFIVIVGGLIALLYLASLAIVRIGQRFIDRQAAAQAQAAAREQLWHREKMAALSAMAANVAHEVGNPLAVIAGVAQAIPDTPGDGEPLPRQQILAQTSRIAHMMRKMADFAAARSEAAETVDLNALVEAVCEFQGFDRRFRRKPIRFLPGANLPARELVPDHLNEVMMNLLQACADVADPEGQERAIRVATSAAPDGDVSIDLSCYCPKTDESLPIGYVTGDARYEVVRRRVADIGGRIEVDLTRLRIVLPPVR
jgi:signal transduction histidine kinase